MTTAATNGTQRALSKALLDSALQKCYQAGANVTHASMSPYAKRVFSTFMSDSNVSQFRTAVSRSNKNVIHASADIYDGDFGEVMMVPNRVQATDAGVARNVFLIDPSMLEFCWFRKIKEDTDVVANADAKPFVMIGEGTLKVKNEAGVGVIADVFGLTASS